MQRRKLLEHRDCDGRAHRGRWPCYDRSTCVAQRGTRGLLGIDAEWRHAAELRRAPEQQRKQMLGLRRTQAAVVQDASGRVHPPRIELGLEEAVERRALQPPQRRRLVLWDEMECGVERAVWVPEFADAWQGEESLCDDVC